MKVDISPNLPPSSSWTTEAPTGSGVEGGGSSACRRSRRMIMGSLSWEGGVGLRLREMGNLPLRKARLVVLSRRSLPWVPVWRQTIARLVPRGGFEPPAYPLGGDRSIQLSY